MASITFTSPRNPNTRGTYTAIVEYSVAQEENRSVISIDRIGFTTTGAALGPTRASGYLNIGGKRIADWYFYDGNTMTTCEVNPGAYGYIQDATAFYSTQVTLEHNPDGTCVPEFQLDWELRSWGMNTVWTSNNQKDTQALPTIPRGSGILAEDTTLGLPTTISITRYVEGFTETICWACGTLEGILVRGNTQTQLVWVPGAEIAEQVPEADTAEVTITAITYDGAREVERKVCVIRCRVPEQWRPTVQLEIDDAAGHLPVCGGYVQNQSLARVRCRCAGAGGSRIVSCVVTVGKLTASGQEVTMALPDPGMVEVRCTVTDSRGREGVAGSSISVLAYASPAAAIVSLGRCDSDGTANPQGAYGRAEWSCAVSPIPGSEAVVYGIRKVHGGEEKIRMQVRGGVFLFPADVDSAYDITVEAADRFTSFTSAAWVLPVAFLLLDFDRGRRAIGIGSRANTADALSLGVDINMEEHSIGNLCSISLGKTSLTEGQLAALLELLEERRGNDNI